jgi:oligopeptide/dipeptide ABC transporter ATP-binding protein
VVSNLPNVQQNDVVLDVRELKTHLFCDDRVVKAVDGVSFQLRKGESLGIVGESGCGKTMTALSLMRLTPQPIAHTVGGQIILNGEDILGYSEGEMQKVRGSRIAWVPQDPHTSLNPVFNVGRQLLEVFHLRNRRDKTNKGGQSVIEEAIKILEQVRLPAPKERMVAFPHQMSGGMKQRVVGAISLSLAPSVLIADEPTTALDVTIQAQYLRLLKELQSQLGFAIIFITHDFGIVARMCDRVAVMYAGRIVETGMAKDVLRDPSHPYTQALIDSIPQLDKQTDRLRSIEGQPPPLDDLPVGCRFAARCEHVHDRCLTNYPSFFSVGNSQNVACWLRECS